jgi:hypothetical protein
MAKRASAPGDDREVLLKEYEFSQLTAQSMENTIWQSSAVIGLGLIGSFLLIALRGEDSQPPWYVACLIAPTVFILSAIWWLVARRWWSVQHAMFIRMRHIERRLGMHSLNYVRYLDNAELMPSTGLSQAEKSELNERREKDIFPFIKDHQKRGVQEFIWIFPLLLVIVWLLYAAILFIVQTFGAG